MKAFRVVYFYLFFSTFIIPSAFCENVKVAEFNGQFYPADKISLEKMVGDFLQKAKPRVKAGKVFALISPHAGYGYSGQTAAFGYKFIQNEKYNTVIILGTSHHRAFNGVALYPEGEFVTPLGKLEIDAIFTRKLLGVDQEVNSSFEAFAGEHSVEVELPFLQMALGKIKIVPIIVGDCSLETCRNFSRLLKSVIGDRRDILVVVSSDMYHGYDFEEADVVDSKTLDILRKMDAESLYYGLREGNLQMCGGFGAVICLMLAKDLGYNNLEVLERTNSAIVTGSKQKGIWTVGYASCSIIKMEEEGMLSKEQKTKLLKIARNSIESYLKNGKKLEVNEPDVVLNSKMGAFVTLHKSGQLRGCIGNLAGDSLICKTVRDMAIEAAVGDPRFVPLKLDELKDIEIEISVLSPMQRVDSAEKIELGKHGVLVRKGFNSGVFLPQVALETGWSKEEFLAHLCVEKAGLDAKAWKDKATELYIFTAEVFCENKSDSH